MSISCDERREYLRLLAVAATGVGGALDRRFNLPALEQGNLTLGNIASHTAVGAVSLLASAATRSAIAGSSFGDNIRAGLPDVIGQVLGRALVGAASDGPLIDPVTQSRATLGEIAAAQIEGAGGTFKIDGNGNLVIHGLSRQAIIDVLGGGADGGPVSGEDIIRRYGDGLGYTDTVPDHIQSDMGVKDLGGVRYEFVGDNVTVSSSFFGIEGRGVTRFIEAVYDDGYFFERSGVFVFSGEEMTISRFGVRVSFGEKLQTNEFRQAVRALNANRSDGSYFTSTNFFDAGPSIGRAYSNRLREGLAPLLTNVNLFMSNPTMGLAAFGGTVGEAAVNTGLDLMQSSFRGRGLQPAPVDRQTTDVTVTTVGLMSGVRGGQLLTRPRLGSPPVAAESVPIQPFSRSRITSGFQDHHIISDKNPLTMNHELLDLSGYNLQSRSNKIFLPETAAAHPTRSIHSGRHLNSVSQNLADQMDTVVRVGRQQGWNQSQYRQAMDAIVAQERSLLRSGERALNKNAR